MISLRYHVVSTAAVFLALAIGVVLGSTALSGALLSGLADEKGDLARQVSDLGAERAALAGRLADVDGFAAATGPMTVRGLLDQRTVVLVTTADARPADRDVLRGLVASAGATVTGELRLTEAFGDPARADQLRELVVRLLPAGLQLPTASDPGTLAGGLLGQLMLLRKSDNQPQTSQNEATAALAGLVDGGFVRPVGDFRPGQLAMMVTGGGAAAAGAGVADLAAARTPHGVGDRAALVGRFAAQVDRAGAGAVLAGRAGSADGTGPIGVIRADPTAGSILSTVDNVDTAVGRVATIMALRQQLDGAAGHYGTAGNAQDVSPGGGSGG